VSLGQTFLILTYSTDSCITAIILAVLFVIAKKYGTWDLQKLGELIRPKPSEAGAILEAAAVNEPYVPDGSKQPRGENDSTNPEESPEPRSDFE
jgi:hypothetical protein